MKHKLVILASILGIFSLTSVASSQPKVIFSPHIEGKDPSGIGVFVRDVIESSLTEQAKLTLLDRAKLTTALTETATSEIQSSSTIS